jgi:prepilin-type N-terminal cleavage/methylation domain-containing protein
MPRARNIRGRRGLTLAELICATAMLGIVLMAASALISASAAGWKHTDVAYRVANLSDRAGSRVEEQLTAALCVLQVKTPTSAGGAAYLFYWKSDGITGGEDGKAQFGEVALIEFDPTQKSVRLYEPIAASAMTPSQLQLAQGADWGDPTSADVVAYYKTMGFVAAPQKLIGGQAGASEVTSATFSSYAPVGAKPAVSYSIALTQNGLAATRQGTVTLRAARKPKNLS